MIIKAQKIDHKLLNKKMNMEFGNKENNIQFRIKKRIWKIY